MYSSTIHFFTGLAITVLSPILVNITCRVDKISWKQIGMGSIGTNIFSFTIGTIIWLVTAAISLAICFLMGWAEITVTANLIHVLIRIFILYITVFLIEAFPEELIGRGYFRAKSGNVWTTIGFHAVIMTATQILNPIHGYFDVNGIFVIQFFAFNLLPYILGAIALEYIYPKHNWREIVPFNNK